MLERMVNPGRFTTPDSVKCPKCGKYGKGPLVRENGDVHILHRIKKDRPNVPPSVEIETKRSVYCVIALKGKPV